MSVQFKKKREYYLQKKMLCIDSKAKKEGKSLHEHVSAVDVVQDVHLSIKLVITIVTWITMISTTHKICIQMKH
jgi:hypothetical protein